MAYAHIGRRGDEENTPGGGVLRWGCTYPCWILHASHQNTRRPRSRTAFHFSRPTSEWRTQAHVSKLRHSVGTLTSLEAVLCCSGDGPIVNIFRSCTLYFAILCHYTTLCYIHLAGYLTSTRRSRTHTLCSSSSRGRFRILLMAQKRGIDKEFTGRIY